MPYSSKVQQLRSFAEPIETVPKLAESGPGQV